jgi:ATP-dependent protease HslVU (ClpYQ) peptidase subunit
MTCIATIVDNGNVWMACDQQVSGSYKAINPGLKVFTSGDFIIGVSGMARIANLLRHSLEPPRRHPDVDLGKFMATEFVNAMRICLHQGGQLENDKGIESAWQSVLVGVDGRVFDVGPNFSCLPVSTPYMAAGSGMHFAFGSLWATATLDGWTPQRRLENAIQAAIAMDIGCGGVAEVACLRAKTREAA